MKRLQPSGPSRWLPAMPLWALVDELALVLLLFGLLLLEKVLLPEKLLRALIELLLF